MVWYVRTYRYTPTNTGWPIAPSTTQNEKRMEGKKAARPKEKGVTGSQSKSKMTKVPRHSDSISSWDAAAADEFGQKVDLTVSRMKVSFPFFFGFV